MGKQRRNKRTTGKELRGLFIVVFVTLFLFSSLNMAACGKKMGTDGAVMGTDNATDDVVIRVGDKTVTIDEVMFYVLCVREQYEGYFGSEVWCVDFGNGRTFEDMCKDDILNEIIQLKVITTIAEDQGVTVTEDEADEIADTVREQLEEISIHDQAVYHIDQELLEKIYHDNYLSSKMFDVVTSEVNTFVSDEEARQGEFLVLTLLTSGEDKNRNEIALTEEEVEQLREKAEELKKQAEEGADFDSLAMLHSDLENVSVVLGREGTEMDNPLLKDTSFVETALTLHTGEVSQVIEGEQAFYLVYCVNEMDEDATAQAKETIIMERQDTAFRELYEQWAADIKVEVEEEKWKEVTFQEKEVETSPEEG